MKAIKRKNCVFAALIGLSILSGTLFFAFKRGVSEIWAWIFQMIFIAVSVVAAGLWVQGQDKLKTAQLITENPIFSIKTVLINDLSTTLSKRSEPESVEVVVSYFGILMGDKIIKFNQNGVWLRGVEIGEDFVSFTYGRQNRTRNIRLLRPAVEQEELKRIAEKFRYETGVIPILLS